MSFSFVTARTPTPRVLVSLALATLGVATSGCQLAIGVESRDEDPVRDGCALPAGSENLVRLANLRPAAEGVDVCLKAASESEYHRPLFHDAGLACPTGASFKQVTGVFSAPDRSLDVRVFPAGTAKCDGTPIAESHVDLAADGVTTLAILGGGSGTAVRVQGMPERLAAESGSFLRFVNAIGGIGNLKFGVANDARLPTTMAFYAQPEGIPLGGVLAPGPTNVGAVDDRGYLELLAVVTSPYAASREDSDEALLLTTSVPPIPSTMFAIGDPNDRLYPIRGLVCADSTAHDLFESCTETDPPSIAVDVFSAGLIGLFGTATKERRVQIPGAIAGRTSDLMCITEVPDPADRQAIIDAAKTTFPYSYQVESDLTTPFSDPRDLAGNVPVPPSTPPCQGWEPQLEAIIECAKSKCSTVPNDGSGRPSDGSCITTQCVSAFAPLVFSDDPAGRRCVTCAQAGILSTETWDYTEESCKTDPHAGLVYRGATPSVILSKYPLVNTEAFQLPSTTIRRAVLAATIQLELGVSIDYYCAHFVAPQTKALPYTGQYGVYSFDNENQGWFGEQAVEAQRTLEFVQRRSGAGRAIIAGDFNVSVAVPGTTITDRNPDVMRLLRSTYQEAIPANYTPLCTACEPPANPYNKGKAGYWEHDIFLHNFAPDASVSAGTFFTDFTVTTADGTLGPISPYFGFNSRVLRR